ncbi:ABC transporter permease [Paenibacillus xylaniclasticus]|uniref:ABC transporter permease n=1 Tax=Paenibacillus xylaniclasticus TaxID=588083 RepID=UPI000FD7C972|nr:MULTISPECIES: ABC transporter permease [Paenibacillus]GFN32934.1 ABC transporter permease [Paenibacillus curdlanolyticus]
MESALTSNKSSTFPKEETKEKFIAAIKDILMQSLVIVLIILFWEIAPRTGTVNPDYLPPLSEVLKMGWSMIESGELWDHFSISITRSLNGFVLALIFGIPIGLLIGWYPLVRDIFNPLFEIYRNTSTLALLPIFILFLGIGEESKVALIFYACTAEIIIQTISGVKNVDPLLIRAARSMNVSSIRIFMKVIWPAALPIIFVGIRMAASGCVLILVAAEMIGARSGLGQLILSSQYNFETEKMYVGILSITCLGLLINAVLKLVEKRLLKWKE